MSEDHLERELLLAHRGSSAVEGSECGREEIRVRVTPIGVIDGIERLPPELQADLLSELKVLMQRGIEVEDARSNQGIPANVSERAKGLRCKRRGVEEVLR